MNGKIFIGQVTKWNDIQVIWWRITCIVSLSIRFKQILAKQLIELYIELYIQHIVFISGTFLFVVHQVIALFAMFAVCSAGVSDITAEVLRSESVVNPDSYEYNYQTSNGISAGATGTLKEISKDESAIVSKGQYSYKTSDGENISISYIADENGFQPQGSILPTPPPIPAAIGNCPMRILNSNSIVESYCRNDCQIFDMKSGCFLLFCSSCFGIPRLTPTTWSSTTLSPLKCNYIHFRMPIPETSLFLIKCHKSCNRCI